MANLVGGSIIWNLDVDDRPLNEGLARANKSIQDAGKKVSDSSGAMSDTFKKLGGEITDVGKKMSLSITAPIAAVSAIGLNFLKIGGQYSSVEDSFKSMTEGMGIDAKEFQKAVADATGGQIDNLTILQGATRGLSLIGGDAFNDFGADFVKMASLSKKAARATGQDVDFMFDSLVLGISRESKLILDNLGVSLDITKAKEDYAKSLGKTTDDLTQSEQKHAVLNATLGQLESTYGNVAISAGGFSGAWQQLTTFLTNTRIEIGQKLEPTFSEFTKSLTNLAKDIMPKVVDIIKKALDAFNNLDPNTQKVILTFVGLIAIAGPVIVILGGIVTAIGALISPIGLVVIAIVLLATYFVKKFFEIRDSVNWWIDFIKWSFNGIVTFFENIGSSIINALTEPFNKALDSIKNVANKIKEAANNINPFARHSPSLVDNVIKGIGVIKDEYASLRDVKLPGIMASLPTISEPAYASAGMGSVTGGGFKQDVNINIDKIQNQSDVEALGREFGFRQSLLV